MIYIWSTLYGSPGWHAGSLVGHYLIDRLSVITDFPPTDFPHSRSHVSSIRMSTPTSVPSLLSSLVFNHTVYCVVCIPDTHIESWPESRYRLPLMAILPVLRRSGMMKPLYRNLSPSNCRESAGYKKSTSAAYKSKNYNFTFVFRRGRHKGEGQIVFEF